MSTVFYGFRIPKSELLPLVTRARKYYGKTHPILSQLAVTDVNVERMLTAYDQWVEKNGNSNGFYEYGLNQFREMLVSKHMRLDVRFQLFNDGPDHYLGRVLEWGYGFQNKKGGWGKHVERYEVDTRTDEGYEVYGDAKYRGMITRVRKLDVDIRARRSMVVDVVSMEDVEDAYFDLHSAMREREYERRTGAAQAAAVAHA